MKIDPIKTKTSIPFFEITLKQNIEKVRDTMKGADKIYFESNLSLFF